tara:strand:- start:357 stop:791 length:435 start_codon:yes stop_codon:yes gene_type:complete
MAQDDYTPLLIGAGALLILAKWGFSNIPNPLPAVGRAAAKTADELTGGLQKDRDESVTEWLFEFDVPFSDKRFPIAPGLVRERGAAYSTGEGMAELPWVSMDIVEPDQPWGSYLFELDFPGLPAYDVRDAPVDLYESTIGRVMR